MYVCGCVCTFMRVCIRVCVCLCAYKTTYTVQVLHIMRGLICQIYRHVATAECYPDIRDISSNVSCGSLFLGSLC